MHNSGNTKQGKAAKTSRRQVLCATGTGISWLLDRSLLADEPSHDASKILQRGDQIDIGGKGAEILQWACDLGYEYEKQHDGCARCTGAAQQNAVPFVAVDESLFRGPTCPDGGATPTDAQNCGAFTGAGMVVAMCAAAPEAKS